MRLHPFDLMSTFGSRACLTAIAWAASLISSAADETGAGWPGFRGMGNSHTEIADLPREWSDKSGIAWRGALEGEGQSSPVVIGDLAFVSSTGGERKENLFLEAFRIGDGTRAWLRRFDATQTVEQVTDMISRGAPTPVADAGRVYVFFESGDLFALDHGGNPLWERRIVKEFGEFVGGHGIGTSLVNTPEKLLLLVDHDGPSYLICLDKRDGRTLWKSERTSRVSWSTPLYLPSPEGDRVVVSSNGSVDAYDLETGRQIWTVTGIRMNTVASPSTDGEIVVVGASAPTNCLAVRLGGKGDVGESHVLWRAESVTSSFGSPLIHRGMVYFVNRAGVVQAVDIRDGKVLWQYRLPGSTWASPLAAGERVYFFCRNGSTAILEPDPTGPNVVGVNELAVEEKDRVYGYAVVPGKILLRLGRELICLGE